MTDYRNAGPISSHPSTRPTNRKLVMSANGYTLEVRTRSGGQHSLCAYWPAPYFVLVGCDSDKPEDKPILYHAKPLADAQRFAASGGQIFHSDFAPLLPDNQGR